MFEVICTGLNLNYGKKGEKRLLNDNHTLTAIKQGWITNKFKWVGSEKTARKVVCKEEAMPFKKINVEKTLELTLKRMDKIIEEVNKTRVVVEGLKKMIEGKRR